jgi:phosphohistidine swiveling domain-containing protein
VANLSDLRFEPPGSGSWKIDDVHYPRPVTRFHAELYPPEWAVGYRAFTARYGMLLDYLELAYVNGLAYVCPHMITEDQFENRLATAEQVFERKLWRQELERWDSTLKPESVKAHREIQSVEPRALDDDNLLRYLDRCREHLRVMMRQHMDLTGGPIVTLGDFLVQAVRWTGLSPAQLMPLMGGATPVSAGSSEELEHIVAAVRADPSARRILTSERDSQTVLDQLISSDGDVGRALKEYVELVGYRLLDGFDVGGPFVLEVPETLMAALRTHVESVAAAASADELAERTADVRRLVPDAERSSFDAALAEARLMYRLRDERGVFSDIWAAGMMRRAILAAAERVAGLHDPADFAEASYGEMRARIAGEGEPSATELRQRAELRRSYTAADAPAHLGDEPSPPPDPSTLPPPLARLMSAVSVFIEGLFESSDEAHERGVIRGIPASAGVIEGTARVIQGPQEFDRIREGDVLVTGCTSEAFNLLLPLLTGIVTDAGGILSHPAIVARECGIPAVVGTRDASRLVPDGTRVRVDGEKGEIQLLE